MIDFKIFWTGIWKSSINIRINISYQCITKFNTMCQSKDIQVVLVFEIRITYVLILSTCYL